MVHNWNVRGPATAKEPTLSTLVTVSKLRWQAVMLHAPRPQSNRLWGLSCRCFHPSFWCCGVGIKPGALCMWGKHSNMELHPGPNIPNNKRIQHRAKKKYYLSNKALSISWSLPGMLKLKHSSPRWDESLLWLSQLPTEKDRRAIKCHKNLKSKSHWEILW